MVHIAELGFMSFVFCVFNILMRKEYTYRSHLQIGIFPIDIQRMHLEIDPRQPERNTDKNILFDSKTHE